jgi:hypothetical protein
VVLALLAGCGSGRGPRDVAATAAPCEKTAREMRMKMSVRAVVRGLIARVALVPATAPSWQIAQL